MLDAVIRLSLRHRSLILVLALAVLAYGGYLTTVLPIDVFPDLDRPRVVILTECPGMSPEEVETLVSYPIETTLLGAHGVQAVRSQSSMGLSVIYAEFDWQTDIRIARQVVQERLATVLSTLPSDIRPQMMPQTSIMGQIMVAGVYRQKGPRGGDLFPVGKTGLLVERLPKQEGETGRQGDKEQIMVWRPVDRNRPETWQQVAIAAMESRASGRSATHSGAERLLITLADAKGKPHEVILRTPLQQRMDLRATADWVIRPRLLQVPGIAEVLLNGGDSKQYQVLINPDALQEHGISLAQVEQVLKENNENSSGGFTIEGQRERPIRLLGRLGPQPWKVVEDLKKIPIKTSTYPPLTLDKVARIEEAPEQQRGDGSIDGHAGVVITLVKQPHVDTRALTDRIKAALHAAEEGLTADYVINTNLFQFKSFIDRGIYYVGEALVIGATLVIIVLFLFLLNFRTTFITLTAIPLSLAVTAVVFKLVGVFTGQVLSINVMTLGGIAVAMGELVDDAIVDVENIYRRLREWNLGAADGAPGLPEEQTGRQGEGETRRQEAGHEVSLSPPLLVSPASPSKKSALRVVYEASKEIRSAIVFGTMVVILVFLPLFALSGVEGRLFAPLGIAYIVSILASLLVSLTVTPVLSYYLLPQSRATHREKDSLLLRGLKWLASYLIRSSMRFAGWLLFLTWVLAGMSFWQLTRIGTDFLPPFDEGSIQINVSLPPGSSLQASNEVAKIVEARLRSLQQSPSNPHGEILHFLRRTGRAELDEHAEPVSNSEYILSMNPESGRGREEMLRQLLANLKKDVPGVDIEAEQPLAHLISHMLSGVQAQIAIKVFGDDIDTLQRLARQIKGEISDVPGITAPILEPLVYIDELHIVLRPDDLALYGVSRQYVAEFVRAALRGEVVSQVLEGQRRFDLVIWMQEPERKDYHKLQDLRIDLPEGRGQITLGDVADFPQGAVGPNQLMRENVRRRAVIRCNVLGRDLGSAVTEIRQRIQAYVPLPEGYYLEYGGQFESQRSATLLIGVLAGVAVVGMFVVLLALQPSVRLVLQILNAIPTAFIGGVLALVLTGQTLTVASLVGFVSLSGIAVRNGILLVTHYFHLMKEEGEGFTQQMVLRGSLERLSPVLMTALTAGIGLLPLVVGGQKPGLEILYPVATVILGGLVTSTFCEFLIHPGLFWRFSGKDAERLATASSPEAELLARSES